MTQAPPPISTMLPAEVRLSLAAAAKLVDPFQRAKAIDRAIARARLLYPQYFRGLDLK
ncbi:hypothetical protein [Bordetella genomosp. 9]|uniref:hypothetical protein n=1 Tax=Bordetella genomosp. 9 TaxID=1416803 RepID=UPI0015C5FD87|nr:hypothetical protein [Bordetella genomosp. 9]